MLLRELTIDQPVRFVTFKASEDLRDRTRLQRIASFDA
jgi:hypothetical protein